MKFIIDRKKYIDSGLVEEREHPDFPLVIYNYAPECQFSKAWDEVTTMCRGLIVHKETREIIARPFPKFFNYEEYLTMGKELPNEVPKVYSKFDGSLGILYWWEGKPYIATRGSFISEQAQWATDWISKRGVPAWVDKLDRSYTHLFEIIYPENKIVVNYNFDGLIHLASIETETGRSIEADSDFPMAAAIPFTSYEELRALNTPNEEGFVFHYPKADLRVKVKFEDYVRLHKIITGLSAIGIWESLLEGKPLEIKDVPDEFYEWYNQTKEKLVEDYERIEKAAKELYASVAMLEDRKEKAAHIFKNGQRVSSIVFSIMDGKPYQKAIWRMVRPKGLQVFKKDVDA